MSDYGILVFAYKRPGQILACLTSLSNNLPVKNADVIICVDGLKEKDRADLKAVAAQAEVINIAQGKNWGRTTEVIINPGNLGLLTQYFSKIEYMLERYENVVIVEEDMIVGNYFLDYMQNSFMRFGKSEGVLMILGYVYNIEAIPKLNGCSFATGSGNKALGVTRTFWKNIDKKCEGWEELKTNKNLRKKYNTSGVDLAAMLIDEIENNRNNSWDSILHWNSFNKNLLKLCPDRTLAIDNGWGDEASNCFGDNLFDPAIFDANYKITNYPVEIKEDKLRAKIANHYFKYTLRYRFWKNRIKNIFSN